MSNRLLNAFDFDKILNNYAGRTIPHTPVTQSVSNITGEETLTDGTVANIKCYVMKTGQTFNYKDVGFIEMGDMIGLFKIADGVKINSKLTINGEVYRVKQSYDVPGVFDSTGEATLIYTVANLFLVS